MSTKEIPCIISSAITTHHHQIFLDDVLESPFLYRHIINLLTTAPECDTVEIIINSVGGRLDAASAIIEAIYTCNAKLRCVVVGNCMSAATLIMLACPEIHVTQSARVMVHACSLGAWGKISDVKSQIEYAHTIETKMMREAYMGFLSYDELEELEKGKEFWFDAEQTIKRIAERDKFLEDLHSTHPETAE